MAGATENADIFRVVVNHQGQYSLWALDRQLPAGWKDAGHSGTRAECLEHIEVVWTDMRPRSLRNEMAESGL